MTEIQWKALTDFREEFKNQINFWKNCCPELMELERKAAIESKTPDYPFENSIVYNSNLDKIQKDDEIKLIVIGDNPGKDEQLNKNCSYLVGQAGKIADGFFRRNPELGIDFRKNVIILNKTPIHSAKTVQLKKIIQFGGPSVNNLLQETQKWMAEKTAQLHKSFEETCELWLVGYSELKKDGFFTLYRDELKKAYTEKLYMEKENSVWDKVFVFQHFSMNRFTIDLSDFCRKNEEEVKNKALIEKIHQLGLLHKTEIFGN